VKIVEKSDVMISNTPSVSLVDIDNDGYKRMVCWIPCDDRVYEIAYNTKKGLYSDDIQSAKKNYGVI
jgi:hypothetical protein